MRRHDETWQFAFPDKDNKIEIEKKALRRKFYGQLLSDILRALQH
jgi:hypothetical protein